MGSSPSIQDMENKEDDYRAYINKIEQQLEDKAKNYGDDMDAKIKAFYTDNDYDKTDFISGRNSDFMQASDWSLANVKKIIDAISKAVFGDGTTPDGVQADKNLGKSIAAEENLELYVAGKCFEVLSGIVESFGSASSVSFNSSYKSEPLGNGLRLFATVVCDSYKSSSFFDNQEIYQYLYIYEVKYSVEEAKTQEKMTLTALYEDQIAAFSEKIEGLLEQLTNDKITPQQYSDLEAIYNGFIANATAALNALKQQNLA
ncbi:MAG: hypothetical protein AAGC84_04740 [Pseudomonas sp.]